MKRALAAMAAAAAAALLAGCDAEISTPVNRAELDQPLHEVVSRLDVQISSCTDMQDKRLESDDVIKIRKRIGLVFPRARYLACGQKDFISVAQFEMPVSVGLRAREQKVGSQEVSISTRRDSDGDLAVTLEMGEGVRRELANLKENSFVEFKPKITLALMPAAQKEKALVPSAFINGEPYHNVRCTINPERGVHRFTLSDVGVAQALSDGFARLMLIFAQKPAQ